MRRIAAAALLAAAAASAHSQDKPAERRPLNLKLDNPGAWATTAPEPDKHKEATLPSLGADARPVPQAPPPKAEWGKSSPHPPDSTQR